METTITVTREVNGSGYKPFGDFQTRHDAVRAVLADYPTHNLASTPRYQIAGRGIDGVDLVVCPCQTADATVGYSHDGERVVKCRLCDRIWPYSTLDGRDSMPVPHIAPAGRRPSVSVSHDPRDCNMCQKALNGARTHALVTGSIGAMLTYEAHGDGTEESHTEHRAGWSTGRRRRS